MGYSGNYILGSLKIASSSSGADESKSGLSGGNLGCNRNNPSDKQREGRLSEMSSRGLERNRFKRARK